MINIIVMPKSTSNNSLVITNELFESRILGFSINAPKQHILLYMFSTLFFRICPDRSLFGKYLFSRKWVRYWIIQFGAF